jgi:hypothetical protein
LALQISMILWGLALESLLGEGGGDVVNVQNAEAVGGGVVFDGGDDVVEGFSRGNGVGEAFHGVPPGW